MRAPASGPDRAPSRPWVVRLIVIAAVVVVVGGVVAAIATGTLFAAPGR